MLEANLARNFDHDASPVEAAPAPGETTLGGVSAATREQPAANEGAVRNRKRSVRPITWDDGGLKPFRLG